MKFTISREVLLQPLSQVIGVVERRQTLPVLANFMIAGIGKLHVLCPRGSLGRNRNRYGSRTYIQCPC